MKNFYTLLLASAVAFSASAAAPAINGNLSIKGEVAKHQQLEKSNRTSITFKKVAELDGTAVKPLDKVGDKYTITGEYVAELGDYYFQTSVGEVEESIEIKQASDGLYVINPLEGNSSIFGSQVPFYFDAVTNTITFEPYEFGLQSGGYYVEFTPIYWDNNLETVVLMDSYEVEFDATSGEIIFDLDHGFGWPAYEDEADVAGSLLGWAGLFDVLAFVQEETEPIDEVQEGQWITVGEATLVDGWVLPGWGENPANSPYAVELQRNVNNDKVFRLWEPYKNSPVADYNISEFHGQIVFDITDPAHVVIEAGLPAGYKDDYDNQEQYNFGLLGWQIHGFGGEYDADLYWDVIIDFMTEKGQPFDVFDPATRVLSIAKPVFDYSRKCDSAYSWNTVYPASITLPVGYDGVNDIISDSSDNAPVRYYNLQGVEIANPTEGALYIKVEGKNATKVLVK